jgi:hypothetical protein
MRHSASLVLLASTILAAAASAAAPPPPDTGSAPPSPRMQKLQQLNFDRRPSAVLKAWAPKALDKKDDKKPDPLDLELKAFQRNVTLGHWEAVRHYLAGLPKDEAKAAYQRMLQSLQSAPMAGPQGVVPGGMADDEAMRMQAMMARGGPGGGPGMAFPEKNQFSPDDIIGLAAAAPVELQREHLASLAGVLRQCLSGGVVVEAVVKRLRTEVAKPHGAVLTALQAARLLSEAGEAAEAGVFLPDIDKARQDNNLEALNLLARHYMGKHTREKKLTWLEQAWSATQAVLGAKAKEEQRADQEDALTRAVELAPRLKEELGQRWLDESFTLEPGRGMNILATIGELSSQGLQRHPHSPEMRLKTLRLLKTAVEALLRASPQRAKEWQDTLTLLAACWLREGEVTYQLAQGTGAARMRRDPFGNFFFMNDDGPNPFMMRNPNMPQPISVADILQVRPAPAWLEVVSEGVRPKLAMVLCQLHLKAEEEKEAFPYIEQLAKTHPWQAHTLVEEFVRVWTKNHKLNTPRENTNRFFFFFGFERRAAGIPLTRSQQERNLEDLAGWMVRMKKLPIREIDQELLVKAFTTCHSSAEVYRAEAIEKVFGPIESLKPRVLAELAQQMRENLAGIWRKPEEQNDKKTNRKIKDIEVEVKRGYDVARATVEAALKKFPDDWSLVLARAALLHDQVNYLQELQKSTDYAPKRQEAYKEFARAAELYASRVRELPEEEQSTRVYEQWLYASLGAVEPGMITEDRVPDLREPARIKKAIRSLPGELAEKHLARFANLLFTRMGGVRPHVKYRYLTGGFEIVGDHKQAHEAKKVFDYYKDLVTEIKLDARIDGSAEVGHEKPFGVFVFLRHTREIERESGGFGRYLQNQNTSTAFSFNYGRPTADYRDRFQTAATEALKEHFEVLSMTFETDKVHSRADKEYGWRVTPYAYLLLKARGPQVDRLPPLRLDLDFLDTSGYAVLPVESPAVPLNARPAKGEPRPMKNLEVTQTLDERQADKGKLILEVKATAQGLLPELGQILTVAPEGFEVVKTDDKGVSVSRFQPDSNEIAIQSERTWLVTLQAAGEKVPSRFHFASAREEGAKMEYQRYDDADMVKTGAEVDLEGSYGKKRSWWWTVGMAGGGVVLLGVVGAVVWYVVRRPRVAEGARWQVPGRVTPFTVIQLLEQIRDEGELSETEKQEIAGTIQGIERHFFAASGSGNGDVDLEGTARRWVAAAR